MENDSIKTERILKRLQKGNSCPVVMERKWMEEVVFIETNPKFNSFIAYDSTMSSGKTTELLKSEQKLVVKLARTGEES